MLTLSEKNAVSDNLRTELAARLAVEFTEAVTIAKATSAGLSMLVDGVDVSRALRAIGFNRDYAAKPKTTVIYRRVA